MKTLTKEQIDLLNKPLPEEALKQHPTKSFLSTINAIYVTERLNQVFGVGAWQTHVDVVDNTSKMVVCKTTLEIPEYGIRYECFGGNDNSDRGDAYKGAVTDAITKIGSWLGIGAHVLKNQDIPYEKPVATQKTTKSSKPTKAQIDEVCAKLRSFKTAAEVTRYWMELPSEYVTNDQCTTVCKEVCANFRKQ